MLTLSPLCAVCDVSANYVSSGPQCEKCWVSWLCWVVTIVTFVVLILVAVFLVRSSSKGAKSGAVSTIARIFLNYLQMVQRFCRSPDFLLECAIGHLFNSCHTIC